MQTILDTPDRSAARAAAMEMVCVLGKLEEPILVVSHARPDGDAVGSVAAMTLLLRTLGKDAMGYMPDVPDYLAFAADGIAEDLGDLIVNDFASIVAVDAASKDGRTPLDDSDFDRPFVVNIDHHATNTFDADAKFVNSSASSACEMIHDIAMAAGGGFSLVDRPRFASAVYLGLRTDTGSFAFSLTTPHTLRVAADCMEMGADTVGITQSLANRTLADVRQLAAALACASYACHDEQGRPRLALVRMDRSDLTADGKPNMQPILSMLRSVEHVQVAASLVADEDGCYRVSMRAAGGVNVAAIAETFGGGGHVSAAGCKIGAGQIDALHEALQSAIHAVG